MCAYRTIGPLVYSGLYKKHALLNLTLPKIGQGHPRVRILTNYDGP